MVDCLILYLKYLLLLGEYVLFKDLSYLWCDDIRCTTEEVQHPCPFLEITI